MKQTEAGLIPEDWNDLDFGSLCNLVKTKYNPVLSLQERNCVELEHIEPASGRIIGTTSTHLTLSLKTVFSKGDILFGKLRPYLRKYALPKFDGVCTTEIWVIESRNHHKPFLYYVVQSNKFIEAANLSTGTKMPRADWATVAKLKIAVPPLPEQKAIAEALSDADEWIESLKVIIEKKRIIKQGAMQYLLRPKVGWEVRKLGEVAAITMGQSPASIYYNTNRNGLPLIQGNADIICRETIMRNYTSLVTKRAHKGDIILSVRAPVGEVAKATFDCCIGRGVCAIKFDNDYLFHYLISIENSWSRHSTGSTFDSINSTQLKSIEISMPADSQEQIRIATVLNSMDAEIKILEEKLIKAHQIKQGMMQQLLNGNIRLVKPANSKAAKTLKRVRA